jgi:hypothetical protein
MAGCVQSESSPCCSWLAARVRRVTKPGCPMVMEPRRDPSSRPSSARRGNSSPMEASSDRRTCRRSATPRTRTWSRSIGRRDRPARPILLRSNPARTRVANAWRMRTARAWGREASVARSTDSVGCAGACLRALPTRTVPMIERARVAPRCSMTAMLSPSFSTANVSRPSVTAMPTAGPTVSARCRALPLVGSSQCCGAGATPMFASRIWTAPRGSAYRPTSTGSASLAPASDHPSRTQRTLNGLTTTAATDHPPVVKLTTKPLSGPVSGGSVSDQNRSSNAGKKSESSAGS